MAIKLYRDEQGKFQLVMREKSRGKRCDVDGCGRPAPTRYRKGRRICNRCIMRRWRANNVEHAHHSMMAYNAKKRGIEFALPFAWFRDWGRANGYFERCGNRKGDLTIDRKDNTRGYFPDNIQLLTRSENSYKGTRGPEFDNDPELEEDPF